MIGAIASKMEEIATLGRSIKSIREQKTGVQRELASILCPFSKGDTVKLPPRALCKGHKQGEVYEIWFDNVFGYSLYVVVNGDERAVRDQFTIPPYMNAEIETLNNVDPIMPECEINALLQPFHEVFSDYWG